MAIETNHRLKKEVEGMSVEEAKKIIDQANQEKMKACDKELSEVLAKYGMKLTPTISIAPIG